MKSIRIPNPWLTERWSVSTEKIFFELPKITIGLLSYNRKDDLRSTIDCITKAVQYPDMEVIVVDNASIDGSVDMVKKEFPEVLLVPLTNNIGTAARNNIIEKATGEYIFFYDDDSFPSTPATIHNIVLAMMNRPDICALNTVIYQFRNSVVESKGWEHFSTKINVDSSYEGLFIVEGGVCFRTSVIKKFRFDEHNLWGAEGMDLSLQLFSDSRKMILHRGFVTLHSKSTAGRSRSTDPFLKASSVIKLLFKHFYFPISFCLIFLFCVRRFLGFVLRPKSMPASMSGIIDGIRNSKNFRKYRPKIKSKNLPALYKWYLFMLRW